MLAVEVADLVLIPYRLSAFDLAAIQTVKLVQLLCKPSYVVFTAGAPDAPLIYAEAGELVESYGTAACRLILPGRVAYRHASIERRTVLALEPQGRDASEVKNLYKWTCLQIDTTGRTPGKLPS